MNVCGCNLESKRQEIGLLFKAKEMDVLALSETKLKGMGENDFESIKVVRSGVNEGRAREGVALLLSEEMWEKVIEWKGVSSRIIWVRIKWGDINLTIVSVYAPGSEKSVEEREFFWEQLEECMDGLDGEDRVIVLGDMNARVGNEETEGIIGKFGVPGKNENGEKVLNLCMERGMVVMNTWFQKKTVNKYTWWRYNQLGDRAMMDLVIVDKRIWRSVMDVHAYRSARCEIGSDHSWVKAKFRLSGRVYHNRKEAVVKVLKSNELHKENKRVEYEEKIKSEWMKIKGETVLGVEEEWQKLRDAMKMVAEEVCGMRRVGRVKGAKSSAWWNDREIVNARKRKKEIYERWLQDRNDETKRMLKVTTKEWRRTVRRAEKRVEEEWCERLARNFNENKKGFWKEVRKKTKGSLGGVSTTVKSANGEVLNERNEVSERWSEYFENLLNVEDEREVDVPCMGIANGRHGRIEEQRGDICMEEVKMALRKLKNGKAPGVDEVEGEIIKAGGEWLMEWVLRLFKVCWKEGTVPEEWKKAIIIPLYKGKGEKSACGSYRGISLLSIPGKIYGRVLIERVKERTECYLREEQGGFRQGRGCVDQIFTVKQLCEKYLEVNKEVYIAFMDLEKAYDRVDRKGVWRVLGDYGVGRKLIGAVKSFYDGCSAGVRIGRKVGKWFEVKVGLRQGCVMSLWLFNVYMDAVVREVHMRTQGKGVRMGDRWEVSQCLFADDTGLMADTEQKLQRLVDEFGVVCKKRKLVVNVGKSKVMKVTREIGNERLNIKLNNDNLEEVSVFRYLGVDLAANGRMEEESKHRINEGMKVIGALKKVWKGRQLNMRVKREMYERIVVPTVLYGHECWTMNAEMRRKLNVCEMKALRAICNVSVLDRIRNEEIRERCGCEESIVKKAERGILRWFGHVERMEEDRMAKKVYNAEVPGQRPRGRPHMRWNDTVKAALDDRGMSLAGAKESARDRLTWRRGHDERETVDLTSMMNLWFRMFVLLL
jgi:hypothetical protein